MTTVPAPLPVDRLLPTVQATLATPANLVLQAPPGSGKTTRIPPALVDLVATGVLPAGQVIVLEPRRLAARAAARRIAEERRWTLGAEVGYHVRFDRRAGERTRLLFLTEGILRRRLADDPFLEGVAAVVFDEFHERSLDADLSLALARRVQRDARHELRLVAMSATLETGELARYLGDAGTPAPVLTSDAGLHPVSVEYLEAAALRLFSDPGPAGLVERAVWGVGEALRATTGDVLVFLPGVGEIRRTHERLRERGLDRDHDLLELYGDLDPAQQDAALGRGSSSQARRRVILATNVAETSVTVEGVRAVVDGGYARQLHFDPATGLDRLELGRVSRASADQRAGRAGREAPGWCLRLWTELDHRTLPPAIPPEIARVDLAGAYLELAAWGERPEVFPWFAAPTVDRLEAARRLLLRLGALDAGGVTALGRQLSRFPLHPRLARLLLAGHQLGVGEIAARAAAILAERPAALRARETAAGGADSDLWVLAAPSPRRDRRAGDRIEQIADQLLRLLDAAEAPDPTSERRLAKKPHRLDDPHDPSPPHDPATALGRAVLAAYPDRLARRREPGSPRVVLCTGQGGRLAETSRVRTPELLVALDLDAGRAGSTVFRDGVAGVGETLIRLASGVERSWLPEARVARVTTTRFDPARDRVIGLQQTRYQLDDEIALVLDERVVPASDAEAVAAALVAAAGADLERAVPRGEEPLQGLLARLRFLTAAMPELGLPTFEDAVLRGFLPVLAAGRRSLAELRAAPWSEVVLGSLEHRQRQALDRHAPERLAVPSGSQIRVDYGSDPPVLAVRIQELFGLADTPRLAGGKVAVVLHLLAPNGRPQQVTSDLRSFWSTTYAEVRRELAGRYPKHSWPSDPWNAPPERRPRRRSP